MKSIKTFLLSSLLLTACADGESQFKKNVLAGYEGRCKQVLASKGYSDSEIQSECACEVAVISVDFSTFELMAINAKKVTGNEPMPEEAIANLKRKLQSCKTHRAENSAS